MCVTMEPELTPHRYPCVRCGKLRRLAVIDQLCWFTPQPDADVPDTSCWRAAQTAWRRDQAQNYAILVSRYQDSPRIDSVAQLAIPRR